MIGDIRQAIILVGGRGTRLGNLTQQTPKPLLTVGERPFIEYWLDAIAQAGIGDIILSCGHLAKQFIERYDQKKWHDSQIRCICEEQPAGTGGALALLKPFLDTRFFLINGDSLMNVDWQGLARCLGDKPQHKIGVLSLVPKPQQANRYGTVKLNAASEIIGFQEKNENTAPGTMINGGVYAFFSTIAEIARVPSSLEQDLLPTLAAEGRLNGFGGGDSFIDIGTAEDYARAQSIVPAMCKD